MPHSGDPFGVSEASSSPSTKAITEAVRSAMEQDWQAPLIIKRSPAESPQPLDPVSIQTSQDSAARFGVVKSVAWWATVGMANPPFRARFRASSANRSIMALDQNMEPRYWLV